MAILFHYGFYLIRYTHVKPWINKRKKKQPNLFTYPWRQRNYIFNPFSWKQWEIPWLPCLLLWGYPVGCQDFLKSERVGVADQTAWHGVCGLPHTATKSGLWNLLGIYSLVICTCADKPGKETKLRIRQGLLIGSILSQSAKPFNTTYLRIPPETLFNIKHVTSFWSQTNEHTSLPRRVCRLNQPQVV